MARGSKTGGRKPGSKNKTTTAVKAALVQAFDELGGVSHLVKWGKANPTEFFKLWAKLLPTEIKNADGEAFQIGIVERIVSAAAEGGERADDHTDGGPVPEAGGVLP